jgi:hypothetical protein
VTSEDGRSWAPVVDPSPFSGAVVTGLTVGGPGYVAVGHDDLGGAVWTSVDGTSWERTEEGDFRGARLTATTETPAGLVAAGFRGEAPAAWISLDGLTWAPASGLDTEAGRISSVAATSYGVLAVGPGDSGAQTWISDDGRWWRPLGPGSFGELSDLATVVGHGDAVAVAGRAGDRAAVWIGSGS